MKILVTGATGLVGTRLLEQLFKVGHDDIRVLSRNKTNAQKNIPFPVEVFEWDPGQQKIEAGALENVDIVMHLAGESVAEGRWTQAKKDRILNSRVNSTKLLINTIQSSNTKPHKFITASAIGIYGDRGEETLTAESSHADRFLADVCKKWEKLAFENDIEGMDTYAIRIGIVLAEEGGALRKMLPPFKAGVAGNLGNGKQYMSWIHIDDLVGQFIFLAENNTKHRIFNGVSPSPVTNAVFTKTLGRVIKRPTLFPLPAFVLKILFGEMSEILLASQKVLPTRFQEVGYQYKFESLEDALNDILKHDLKGELILKKFQWLPKAPQKVFGFFSEAKNLEKITPPYLNFKILDTSTKGIEAGTLINYQLKLHGIPLRWRTRINAFEENKSFIDEQIKGPYSKWVHTHDFIPAKQGTLILDHVVYKIPFGILGKIVAGAFIKRDLTNIFNYRQKVISQQF